ncbi:MAG: PilZ domain-containing protein [Candidatus Omnitrophica bacterium]|nr:PilZ domain-containing protein [Candidatus Omnitrophota bacterium]
MRVQRRFQRWQLGREAALFFKDSDRYVNCFIDDLSPTGFKASLAFKLPVDAFLDFELQLSDELCFPAQAWIVWHRPAGELYHYSFHLSRITEGDREKLKRFIKLYATVREKSYGEESRTVMLNKGEARVNDRRIFQRFDAGFSLSFLDVADGSEGSGRIQDISAKGIGFLANSALRPRASLELWLRIPDRGDPLYTRGSVVWAKQLADGQYAGGIHLERADLMGLSRILRIQE